jgi:hypothetical protein
MTGRGGNDRRPPVDMTSHDHSGLRRRTSRAEIRWSPGSCQAALGSVGLYDDDHGEMTSRRDLDG